MTAAAVDASFAAYLTFTTILAVTPGQTTAVVVRNTLRGGHGAGLASAVGAAVANATHATLAGLGLSLLLTHWPTALVVLRVAGAIYLAWLGCVSLWTALTSADGGLGFDAGRDDSSGSPSRRLNGLGNPEPHQAVRAFRDGLAINLVNPAIISFYIAIVPSFIPAGASRWYFVLLAACHVTIALACHSMWATAFHVVRQWFASPAARRVLSAATGVALVFLAARVLM